MLAGERSEEIRRGGALTELGGDGVPAIGAVPVDGAG